MANTLKDFLTSVADQLRKNKAGINKPAQALIKPINFVSELKTTVGEDVERQGDINLTPTESAVTFNVAGKYMNGTVKVNPIPSNYVGSKINRITATTYSPTANDYVIPANTFVTGNQTIYGITTENITPENIRKGVIIKVGDTQNPGSVKSVVGAYGATGLLYKDSTPVLTVGQVTSWSKTFEFSASKLRTNRIFKISLNLRPDIIFDTEGGPDIPFAGKLKIHVSDSQTPGNNFTREFTYGYDSNIYFYPYYKLSDSSAGSALSFSEIIHGPDSTEITPTEVSTFTAPLDDGLEFRFAFESSIPASKIIQGIIELVIEEI